MLQNQCILGLAEEAKQFHIKVAHMEKTNASAKGISVDKRNKNGATSPKIVGTRLERS